MAILSYFLGSIASVVLSIPTLHLLASATNNRVFTFAARTVASVFCLVICASYGVVASIALRLVGYGGLSQWTVARSFKLTMWYMAGITFEIKDPHRMLEVRPAVFVGNHQTELDVLMLGCVFPPYCSVTAKTSLKYYPFLGWFMALSKTVFINRQSSKDARAAFSAAIDTMHKDRQSVYIFPEGTRSYSNKPEMLPFKKGAFHLAVQAQVPVIPIVCANYSNVLDMKRKIFNAGTVPVSVLEAIETKGMTKDDVDGLAQKVRKVMEDELVRISEHAKEQGVAQQTGEKAKGLMDGALQSGSVQ